MCYPANINALKQDQLFPGQCVSMDHFEVTIKGCLYCSMGKTHDDRMFSGSCIFVDHATGHVHAPCQLY